MGDSHPSYPHAIGISRRWDVYRDCHDKQQSEEGSQGQSSLEEEGLSAVQLQRIMEVTITLQYRQ